MPPSSTLSSSFLNFRFWIENRKKENGKHRETKQKKKCFKFIAATFRDKDYLFMQHIL
jgi:hypothetical protein